MVRCGTNAPSSISRPPKKPLIAYIQRPATHSLPFPHFEFHPKEPFRHFWFYFSQRHNSRIDRSHPLQHTHVFL